MQPLVSVIVPAYNHEKYIVECLRSVRDQDYPAIELIVVDDCSTDETAQLCSKFATARRNLARFAKVVFIRHEANLGAHAALNDGIAAAGGRFVAFLNSDDAYAPSRISSCVAAANGDDGFVFSAVRTVDDAGRTAVPDHRFLAIRELLSGAARAELPSTSFAFLAHQAAISTGNMFVPRETLHRAGPFAPLRYCHDWDMAMRLILIAEPIYLPNELYFYRYHQKNSWRELEEHAEIETEYVLRHYFRRIKLGEISNPLAPSPVTWPGVFELYARSQGVYKWWQAESGAYPKGARVIAPAADSMTMDP